MKTIETGVLSVLCLGAALVCAGLTGCASNSDDTRSSDYAYGKSYDNMTAQDVKRALANRGGRKFDGVAVTVYSGVAQLSGSVDTISERDEAVAIAAGVGNVRGTVNNIVVTPNGHVATDINPAARANDPTGIPAKTED